ncbi:MAG TPA: transporter substrate-binding domain-containing protein [Caulobacteraceae bacterium]|nr:transporter substrate-binding domain-containing protein [Caulobacteraceae bacterium]
MLKASQATLAELAPTGRLRVGVNTGNAATTTVRPDGSLDGPSVVLAQAFGQALQLPLALLAFASAGEIVAAGQEDSVWDIAFLAIDPLRAEQFHFSPPYLEIGATYAVAAGSDCRRAEDVDRPTSRIASSAGAAYDLHLQRRLKHASRTAFLTPQASFAAFRQGGYTAVAGVRRTLEANFAGPEFRLLADGFLTIRHAMAVSARRRRAAALVDAFVASQVSGRG